MVRDALKENVSFYYLMTSDTDFEPVIEMLKSEFQVRVGILCTTKNVPKLFLKLSPQDIRHVKLSQVEKAPNFLGAQRPITSMIGVGPQ